MKLIVENPNTGVIKNAPVGSSLTTLFFGGLPALFRGDIKWFFIQLLIAFFTFGLSNLVFAFIYNKIYIQKLLEKGFKVKDVYGGTLDEASKKLCINLPQLSLKTN